MRRGQDRARRRDRAPGRSRESIGCGALVLACNGYGGNPELVARHIPEMRGALYFGHPGNRGDAVLWGASAGREARASHGYQGHGSVAHPHGILITWATITEGGFQVNSKAERFSDESQGYSEQAGDVLAQPGGLAWTIFRRAHRGDRAAVRGFPPGRGRGRRRRATTIEGTGRPAEIAGATLGRDVRRGLTR